MLDGAGVSDFVKLVQMDICRFDLNGATNFTCYDFDEKKLFEAFVAQSQIVLSLMGQLVAVIRGVRMLGSDDAFGAYNYSQWRACLLR